MNEAAKSPAGRDQSQLRLFGDEAEDAAAQRAISPVARVISLLFGNQVAVAVIDRRVMSGYLTFAKSRLNDCDLIFVSVCRLLEKKGIDEASLQSVKLQIDSEPGKGTKVTIRLLRQPEAARQ